MAPGDEINIKFVMDFLWVVPNDVTAEGFLGSFETDEDRDLDERILEVAAIQEEKELVELERLRESTQTLLPKEDAPGADSTGKSDTTNGLVAPKHRPQISFPDRYFVEYLQYLSEYTVLATLEQQAFDKVVQDEYSYLPDLYRTATRFVDQQQDIAKEGTVDAVDLGYFVYYREHHDLLLEGSKEEAVLQGTLSFLKKILQAENEYSAAKLDKIDQLFTDIGSLNEEFDAEINAPANIIYHEYLTYKRCFPFAAVGFEGARSRFSVNAENGCDGVTKFLSQGILPFRKPSVEKFRKYLLDFTIRELKKYSHQTSSTEESLIQNNRLELKRCLTNTVKESALSSSEHLLVLQRWIESDLGAEYSQDLDRSKIKDTADEKNTSTKSFSEYFIHSQPDNFASALRESFPDLKGKKMAVVITVLDDRGLLKLLLGELRKFIGAASAFYEMEIPYAAVSKQLRNVGIQESDKLKVGAKIDLVIDKLKVIKER